MTGKTHWKKLTDPRFLGSHSLPNGEDLAVVIDSVTRELLRMEDDKEDYYLVARFQGDHLPMILNNTNAMMISRLYGSYIEDWPGKAITLYASKADFRGDLVECLRIRPVPPKLVKDPISNTRFKRALVQIRARGFTVAKLLDKYTVTPDQQAALDQLTQELNESQHRQ
jgi:hypothetical protein